MRLAVVTLAILAACGKSGPEHPNVLVITIDTLRADAIGDNTPAIRDFLREATRFRGARTVTPLTLPAHASIFTGLFPSHHGLHDNATEPLPARDKRPFPLLAEQMRDAGYATAAFVARAVLAAPTGIGAGFDLYDCPDSQGIWEEEGGYVPGEERVRAPLAWVEGAQKGKPWFVWVHIFDPHAPYQAFPGDARRGPTRDTDSVEVRYVGEVRRADAAFEKLLREIPPDTIVVLASDHGEGLYEHGEPTHGPFCYGTTIDAVLAVRGPGFERGAVDTGLRSVADVTPTLRRLCHLPKADSDGLDLLGPPHPTLVSESLFAWSIHGWGQVFASTDGRYSLIESGSSVELFDRRSDPGENIPLPLTDAAYEKLDRALERYRSVRWGGSGGEGGERFAAVPPYGELRLHESGYLSRHENAKLADTRTRIEDWTVLLSVPTLIRTCTARRDPMPLQRALKALAEMEKTSATPQIDHFRAGIHVALAQITGDKTKYKDAAWAEISAIEKGYVQTETILPAIEYCQKAGDKDALQTLSRLLRRTGRKLEPEAQQALDAALR